MKTEEIIIVEDNSVMRLGISESLRRDGYSCISFDNGPDALKYFKQNNIPLAIVDLKMQPMDGIEVLREMKEFNPSTEVLIISAFGTVESAVSAMQLGAADFMTKPFAPDELRIRIKKVLEKIQNDQKLKDLIEHNKFLNKELSKGYEEIIGCSASMQKVFTLVSQVAGKDSTVLIQGESGTGKELIAHAIHNRSRRSDCPFIKINCGALNDNLLESELFGHEKGAFTGAIKQKKGRFELANRGTLFLDEIGDVSAAMQLKLLRVLQEGEFERVGGEVSIKCDVRIIAATNQDLQKLISEGKFRSDLFYRLSVIPIVLPPLRERKEDVPLLVDHFLNKLSRVHGQNVKVLEKGAIEMMVNYSWPGNIRELQNLIERLYVISPGEMIDSKLVAQHLLCAPKNFSSLDNLPLEDALYMYEKNLIIDAMKKNDGVKNRAAKALGISTSVLYYKLEKFGLL